MTTPILFKVSLGLDTFLVQASKNPKKGIELEVRESVPCSTKSRSGIQKKLNGRHFKAKLVSFNQSTQSWCVEVLEWIHFPTPKKIFVGYPGSPLKPKLG